MEVTGVSCAAEWRLRHRQWWDICRHSAHRRIDSSHRPYSGAMRVDQRDAKGNCQSPRASPTTIRHAPSTRRRLTGSGFPTMRTTALSPVIETIAESILAASSGTIVLLRQLILRIGEFLFGDVSKPLTCEDYLAVGAGQILLRIVLDITQLAHSRRVHARDGRVAALAGGLWERRCRCPPPASCRSAGERNKSSTGSSSDQLSRASPAVQPFAAIGAVEVQIQPIWISL